LLPVLGGRTGGLLRGWRRLNIVAGNFGESPMQALSELIGGILALGAALSGNEDPRRGHSGETGQPEKLPAHAHSRVG
jgi:hypothetical protein